MAQHQMLIIYALTTFSSMSFHTMYILSLYSFTLEDFEIF